jgi:serine/threonine protein kinase/predicted Zn-dependent protease
MADDASPSSSSCDRDPIERLADSFMARFRAGERPSVEEYAAKYPELASEIRELLPALVELELNQSPGGTATASVESPFLDGTSAGAGVTPRQLGDYLILREIARGGMGVVYEAVQQSLGRHVALKVLPATSLAGSSRLERFRLEARAAARLHHTNIVPVFGVGEHEGVHYYAMQFIQGQGLDEVFEELRRLRGGLSPEAKPAQPSGSEATRARTRAVTHGLLTGQFPEREPAGTGAEIHNAPTEGLAVPATEAGGSGTAAPRSSGSGGSGISAHSELSATQAETRYYRSVARVGLQVAEALAYAHSQGILHRDIKPSNLLLDARGTVWVTDFGLAKAEGADALTHTGDIIGTLRYMAPERFGGWSDPRSDIYALGATLYELLVLRPLFSESDRVRLIDRVVHDAPVAPRKLDKKLPRDLETVVLKAIAKEPAQRYATAEQLAEDLRRFLADKPVLARRSSPVEQALRWCRRNKGLAAGIVLAVLGLVAAVVVLSLSNAQIARNNRDLFAALHERDDALKAARQSEVLAQASAAEATRQRGRAEAGEAQARAAVDEFLTRVTEDALLKAPGLQTLRRDLLRSALRFYDEFLKQRGDDPGLRAALADVHLRVGKILNDLGDGANAHQSFQSARTIYQALTKEKPDDRDAQAGLAECQFRLNGLPEAIGIYEKLIKLDPANRRYRRDLAEAYNSQATRQSDTSKVAEVLEAHRKALALREGLVRELPDDPEARNNLGGTLNNLGVVLDRQGHQQDALAMYLRAVEQGEAAFAKAPQVIPYGLYLGTQYSNVARMLRALGRQDEAIRADQRGIEHWRRLARANPDVPVFRSRLYSSSLELARLLAAQGRKSEAAEWFALAGRALEDQPRKTAGDLYNLACVLARAAAAIGEGPGGTSSEARQERDRLIAAAIDALRQSIVLGSPTAQHIRTDEDLAILRGRADFQALVAQQKANEDAAALAQRGTPGKPEEQLKVRQELLAARAKLAQEDPRNRRHRADLAASQHAVGQVLADLLRYDEAETTLKQAVAAREALAREEPTNVRDALDAGATRLALAILYWQTARLDQADREWTLGLRAMEAALRDQPAGSTLWSELDTARLDVADKLLRLGLWEEAGELLDRVFRRNPASLAPRDGRAWYLHAVLRLLAGDLAGYRASCAAFFQQFRNHGNKLHLYRACLAGAGALPAPDLKALAEMAEQDLGRNPGNPAFLLDAAMLGSRTGDPRRALQRLDQMRPESAPAASREARAIVLHQLGRGDEGRKVLADADRDVEETYRGVLNGGSLMLIDLAENLVLRREGHTLIDGKPAAEGPYSLLARARVLGQRGRDSEFESALAAALAARPGDPQVLAAAARILAERGRATRSREHQSRAMALLDRALASQPDDVPLLRARAELLAQQGEWDRLTTDLARVFAAKETQPRWFVAGTWVVGPYPWNKAEAELARPLPPESDPDPARPVLGPDGKSPLIWQAVTPAAYGRVDLEPLVQPKDFVFAYVLVRVYAPEARDVVALVSNDDWLRFWCNGELRLAQPLWLESRVPVSIHLRAGWNTLLAKVANWSAGFSFHLELTAEDAKVARTFGAYLDKQGWNDRTKALLDRLLDFQPQEPFAWPGGRSLDYEVARRDAVWQDVLTARPKDTRLSLARAQWLAWLGRWDEALAAYDRYLATQTSAQDAHFESAAVLALRKGTGAIKERVARLVERFDPPESPFAGFLLARCGAIAPGVLDDPSRLVRWAEPMVAAEPKAGWTRHTLGLAHLRAGEYAQAIRHFEQSMKDAPGWPNGSPILNWLALALAHHHLGHAAEARHWFELARDRLERAESDSADKTTHPWPPMWVSDWTEALILQREAESLLGRRRLGDITLIDRTAPAGATFRLPLGLVELRHDPPRNGPPGSFRLSAPFRTKSPVADGKIERDEYGPPLLIDFTDETNPGRDVAYAPNPAKSPDDLSAELYLAYTRDDLFVAVKVRDDVLIDNLSFLSHNDAVELFLDGDRLGGDFKPTNNQPGSREGFQAGSMATGRKYAVGVSDQDYVVKTSKCDGGYIVEFRVPLTLIDVDDGAEVTPPGPGSTLRFNLAIVDNDQPVDGPHRYCVLWSEDRSRSPYQEGDGAWPVDLHLARPVQYELVAGPKGAALDPETGVFTWNTPREPRTEKVTVRVRDAEKPELTAEASFTITTTQGGK